MGTVGVATEGNWFDKKMVQVNQQNLVDNLNQYYHQDFRPKSVKTLKVFALCLLIGSLVWGSLRLIWLPYIMREDDLSTTLAIIVIIGCALLACVGGWLLYYAHKKYSHAIYLQNPNKERLYRWKYCVIFSKEQDDYRTYIKNNPIMCPTGVIPIKILDDQTYQVIKTCAPEEFLTRKA